jgi:putative SOS response-associated peptidase YedK
MCGKFIQMKSWGALVRLSDLRSGTDEEETVTPMRFANVVALDGEGRRRSVRMRWGLVPPGAKDPQAGKPHIHARAETIDGKPTFRDSFRQRRGLIAVSSFNEGKEIAPNKTEQYVLTPKDGMPIVIAAIWERWGEAREASLLSFAMVTVPPNDLIATITDRMPALIESSDWAKWLGEEPATSGELKAMLRPSGCGLEMRKAGKPPSMPKKSDQPTFL